MLLLSPAFRDRNLSQPFVEFFFMYLENRMQTTFSTFFSSFAPYSLMVLSLFSAKAPNKPIQVVYVPSHLFHMLFELFKVSGI